MIEKAICLWFLFFILFLFVYFLLVFFILYFVCFGKILSQLEAASSVLPRIETFARCPRVVPSAAPRALRSGNALRFLCSVAPRTQLLILTSRSIVSTSSKLMHPVFQRYYHGLNKLSAGPGRLKYSGLPAPSAYSLSKNIGHSTHQDTYTLLHASQL